MKIVFYARLRKRTMTQDGYVKSNYEIEVPANLIKEHGLMIGEILKVEVEPLGFVLPGKKVGEMFKDMLEVNEFVGRD